MTSQQQAALAFIQTYIKEKGYSPSYREIAEGIGSSGPGKINSLLTSLRDLGYIKFLAGRSRSVEVVDPLLTCVSRVIEAYDSRMVGANEALERVRTITIAARAFQ